MKGENKMTIMQFLEGCEGGTVIKIGAKGGDSFFYIGTVQDFLIGIKSHEIEVRNHANKVLDLADSNLKALLRNYPTPEKYAKKVLNRDIEKLTAESFVSELNAWCYAVRKAKRLVDERKSHCEKIIPLSKRCVIEAADSGVPREDGAKRILIEGNERGAFWMISEAQKTKRLGTVCFSGDVKGIEDDG